MSSSSGGKRTARDGHSGAQPRKQPRTARDAPLADIKQLDDARREQLRGTFKLFAGVAANLGTVTRMVDEKGEPKDELVRLTIVEKIFAVLEEGDRDVQAATFDPVGLAMAALLPWVRENDMYGEIVELVCDELTVKHEVEFEEAGERAAQ